MDLFPIICEAHYFDEIHSENRTSYHPLHAASLAEATAFIEEYYGQELNSVHCYYADGIGTLFEISESLKNFYLNNNHGVMLD